MVSESLLTNEVRAVVGMTGSASSVVVNVSTVRHSQETFLGKAGEVPWEGKRVPSFVLAALGADTESMRVPEVMPNQLLISNEWSVERPLLMGESLTAQAKVADIVERFGGRFGYSIHVRTEVEFRDDAGELVGQSSTTMMQFDASDGGE